MKPTPEDVEAATLLLGHPPGPFLSADRIQTALLLQSQLISVSEALKREGVQPGYLILHPDQKAVLEDLLRVKQ